MKQEDLKSCYKGETENSFKKYVTFKWYDIDSVTVRWYNKNERVYTIEWYYNRYGKSQAFDYFESIDKRLQMKLFYLLKRVADFGFITNKRLFNNEGDGIWAFKPKPFRFLSFFVSKRKIIITNGFYKKTQKLPETMKIRALNYRFDYLEREKEGRYYE